MDQHEVDVKELAACIEELVALVAPKVGNTAQPKLAEISERVRKISARKAEKKPPTKRTSKSKKED